MDINKNYDSEFDCPAVYEIKVGGKINSVDLVGIEDLTLSYQTLEDGSVNTILTGLLIDQAALNGVLNVIHLLQLTIISILKVGDCL